MPERKILVDAVKNAGRFVNPRSPMEAYSKLRLSGDGGRLIIESMGHMGHFMQAVESDCELQAIVEYQKFAGILNAMNVEDVDIFVDNNSLSIDGGYSRVNLPLYEVPWNWPAENQLEGQSSVDAQQLCSCLYKVSEIPRSVDIRFAHGVRISCRDGVISTSARKSAQWSGATGECGVGEIDVIVQAQSVQALSAWMNKRDEQVALEQYSSSLKVIGSDVVCYIPLVIGSPPHPVDKVLAMLADADEWEIPRCDLESFLAQTAVLTTEMSMGVWLIPNEAGVMCMFTGQADGSGEISRITHDRCELQIYTKQPPGESIYIDSSLLAQAIRHAKDDTFSFRVGKAAVFVASEGYCSAMSPLAKPASVA